MHLQIYGAVSVTRQLRKSGGAKYTFQSHIVSKREIAKDKVPVVVRYDPKRRNELTVCLRSDTVSRR